jgi:hypothetical protein
LATTKRELIFSQKGMSRKDIRKKMVEEFLEEKPGPADDETYNRYVYLVEKTKEGNVILVRPANLKLGFDFRIDVEGKKFRNGTQAPSHLDLFEDLNLKYKKNSEFCNKVINAIIAVNDMKDPEEILPTIKDLRIGLSVELILKVSKWFAVEQDIRYWNGWGRNKQVVWLKLMWHYKFRYEPTPQGFKFYDNQGKLLSEDKAAKAAGIL